MAYSYRPNVLTDGRFVSNDGKVFNSIEAYVDYVEQAIVEMYPDEVVQSCELCGTVDWSGDMQPFAVEHGEGLCIGELCHCGHVAIGPDSQHWPYRFGMCETCATVRCDAEPGACRGLV